MKKLISHAGTAQRQQKNFSIMSELVSNYSYGISPGAPLVVTSDGRVDVQLVFGAVPASELSFMHAYSRVDCCA